MPYDLDPNLKEFATRAQWKKLEALAEHGSERKAGNALGIHKKSIHDAKHAVLRKATQRGYSPAYDMIHPAPEGYHVKGVSTLYDVKTGNATIQWVKSDVDKEAQIDAMKQALEGFAADLPTAKLIPAPKTSRSDLMAVYPVGDHHIGMLSWGKETGEDYDTEIAESLLSKASEHLISGAPECDEALIILLGDFLHYDSLTPVTPTSRNQMDTDTRFPNIIGAAFRSIRHMVNMALNKHKTVRVIIEIGNHDLSTMHTFMQAMNIILENEPRVSVDISPMHFHYYRFGQCLVGTHHGHGTKIPNLPGIMAYDRAKDWGETKYRYIYTGHIHQDKKQDFPGCTVEAFRILPPGDAWSHQNGYRSHRDMKSIILHKDYGEVARNTVNPAMLKG